MQECSHAEKFLLDDSFYPTTDCHDDRRQITVSLSDIVKLIQSIYRAVYVNLRRISHSLYGIIHIVDHLFEQIAHSQSSHFMALWKSEVVTSKDVVFRNVTDLYALRVCLN